MGRFRRCCDACGGACTDKAGSSCCRGLTTSRAASECAKVLPLLRGRTPAAVPVLRVLRPSICCPCMNVVNGWIGRLVFGCSVYDCKFLRLTASFLRACGLCKWEYASQFDAFYFRLFYQAS